MATKSVLPRSLAAIGLCLGLVAAAQAGPYSGLYVFGDSLSDSGNDLVITGGAVPVATVYTDGSHTGRFTNGLNYADRMASSLGLGLTASVLGGTDYAYGGARTTYVQAGLPASAKSFNQQIDAFDTTHATADAGALYVLWIGANDMSDAIKAAAGGSQTAIPTAIGTALSGIGGAIQNLASRGAQHFLVFNLPDLSLVPQVRAVGSPGFSDLARSASQAFNVNLTNTLAQGAFSALDIHSFDVYAAQTDITLNPASYGFSNVSSACYSGDVNGQPLPGGGTPTTCADPSHYMYWDFEHPSDALHAELAGRALAAVVPEPAALNLLLAGFGLLGLVRLRRRAAA